MKFLNKKKNASLMFWVLFSMRWKFSKIKKLNAIIVDNEKNQYLNYAIPKARKRFDKDTKTLCK